MSKETITGNISQKKHQYSSAGAHVVKIRDSVGLLQFNAVNNYYNTSEIKSVNHFGGNVTALGNYCFAYCSCLTSVNLYDSNIREIGNYAFSWCDLREVKIPKTLSSINTVNPFSNNGNLSDIVVDPENERFWTEGANHSLILKASNRLRAATSQTTVVPYGVRSIGQHAFRGIGVSSIYVPAAISTFSGYSFAESDATSIYIEDGADSPTFQNVFNCCKNLSSVHLPSTLGVIGTSCFANCTSLTSLELPAEHSRFSGNSQFNGCINLREITFGSCLTSMGTNYDMFYRCTNLSSFDFSNYGLSTVPSLVQLRQFEFVNPDYVITVPFELYDDWISATNWISISSHIRSSATKVGTVFEIETDQDDAELGICNGTFASGHTYTTIDWGD